MMKTVTKCVCKRLTFAEIKVIAAEQNITTLDELIKRKICSSECGMCQPYVKKMLVTGETEFRPGDHRLPELSLKDTI